MATIEQRICDVYGTTKGVELFMVQIVAPSTNPDGDPIDHVVAEWTNDLSPKALKLLKAAIERKLSPPKKRTPKEATP